MFGQLLILFALFSCICGSKKVAILGASGYTGAELTRLIVNHPQLKIEVLTGDRSAGSPFKQIFPQFSYLKDLPLLTKWEDSQQHIEACDVAFCCLPHGTTQEIISLLANRSPIKVTSTPMVFFYILV
jgi:N-acetyl-gamma-glutamylphosphate reductase